jgi:hypothetical protein
MDGEKINICDICGKQFTKKSNFNRHGNVHRGVTYECRYCSKQYSDHSNLTRHEKTCTIGKERETTAIVNENKQLKKIVLKLSSKHKPIEEENKQLKKLVLKLSSQKAVQTSQDDKIQQLSDQIGQLTEVIYELKNKPVVTNNTNTITAVNGNGNVTTNVNIHVHLNDHEVDLYEIKKKMIGEDGAYSYIMGLLNSSPSNKLNWLLDKSIFEKPENIPIRVANLKESKIVIHDKPQSQIQDNGTQLNKICSRIIGRSVSRAMTQQLTDVIQQNEKDINRRDLNEQNEPLQNQIDEQIDDRLGMLYGGSLKENVMDKLMKLDRPATQKHLKEVMGQLSSIEVPL